MPVLNKEKFSISNKTSWCAFLVVLLIAGTTVAQQPASREYQVKAVFVFNFAHFVAWPEEAFDSTASPLVIGVVGKDPFGPFLDRTIEGEKINNHPLTVERYATVKDIGNCHILYVGLSTDVEVREVLKRTQGKPILTVSDVDRFCETGGMIAMFNDGGRVRLRVNVEPANSAGLEISSKLLRLAEVISSTEKE